MERLITATTNKRDILMQGLIQNDIINVMNVMKSNISEASSESLVVVKPAQPAPIVIKPKAHLHLKSADLVQPKLFNKPGTHVIHLTIQKPKSYHSDYHRKDDNVENESEDIQLVNFDDSHYFEAITYEEAKVAAVASIELILRQELSKYVIIELTIDMGGVTMNSSLLAILEQHLSKQKITYKKCILRITAKTNSLIFFAKLLSAIEPSRVFFDGLHCEGMEKIFLLDMFVIVLDNYMGTGELISIVVDIIDQWTKGLREISGYVIRYGTPNHIEGIFFPPIQNEPDVTVPVINPPFKIHSYYECPDGVIYHVKKGESTLTCSLYGCTIQIFTQ